eukprot:579587-Prymnesium_polylepis.1
MEIFAFEGKCFVSQRVFTPCSDEKHDISLNRSVQPSARSVGSIAGRNHARNAAPAAGDRPDRKVAHALPRESSARGRYSAQHGHR